MGLCEDLDCQSGSLQSDVEDPLEPPPMADTQKCAPEDQTVLLSGCLTKICAVLEKIFDKLERLDEKISLQISSGTTTNLLQSSIVPVIVPESVRQSSTQVSSTVAQNSRHHDLKEFTLTTDQEILPKTFISMQMTSITLTWTHVHSWVRGHHFCFPRRRTINSVKLQFR